jgi:methylated-DNA-protein-cysteine methyltransferase related protein
LCSRQLILSVAVFVAATDAETVRLNMSPFRNHDEKHCSQIVRMAIPKKTRRRTEPLRTVSPSGKQQESFFEAVYAVVRQIPKGRVTSYGAIANCLGTKLSARMVGWAMNAAHDPRLKVPAHRVVNRNGMLTGKFHFATQTRMQELLEKEGVKVNDDKVVDFAKKFWDPAASEA